MKKPTIREKVQKTFSDFKSFAFKGSAIDIAIGMMIGAAMTAVVDSLIKDIVNPPIAKLISGIDFSHRYLVLGKNQYESLEAAQEAGAIVITYGNFITAIITFLLTALVLFIIVSWINKLNKKDDEKAEKTIKKCPYCKSEIDIDATRCAFCTSELKK